MAMTSWLVFLLHLPLLTFHHSLFKTQQKERYFENRNQIIPPFFFFQDHSLISHLSQSKSQSPLKVNSTFFSSVTLKSGCTLKFFGKLPNYMNFGALPKTFWFNLNEMKLGCWSFVKLVQPQLRTTIRWSHPWLPICPSFQPLFTLLALLKCVGLLTVLTYQAYFPLKNISLAIPFL